MNTLYIIDNGLALKKRSERIAVKKGSKIIEEIPILDLKRILIFGNNQVSTNLLRLLAGKGIEVSFLSLGGRFQFRIAPDESKNIYLRMAQHRLYNTPSYRISWGRTIVGAKLLNQRNLIKRIQKNQPEKDLSEFIRGLEKSIENARCSDSLENLMGVEGHAATVYFSAFSQALLGDFQFKKRQYHPPPDPINAMLSFGYMLLFNEMDSLLRGFGFDTFLGFLHGAKYGRPSLAADMMEEFRSPVIDRLVLYLINLGVAAPLQFEARGRGVRMSDDLRKAYLTNYEKFMITPFVDYSSRKRKNFRKIIRENVSQLEKCLLNGEDYKPFTFYA